MINCKNCDTQLTPESDYCNSCGGRVVRNRLTLKNLFEHLSETFFNYDNKLLRTCIDLFKTPETVISGYINGTRKKYVNPISFFGLAITLSGLLLFLIKKFFKDSVFPKDVFQNKENEIAVQKMMESISDFTLEYSSLLFSILIPLAAIISMIVFLNKKYNFTEHMVIYLYSLSLYSLLSSVLSLFILLIAPERYLTLAYILYAFILIYHIYALKRLFMLSAKQVVLKTLLFIVLGFVAYIGISILMAIIMFATGIINLQDFVPPKP